jgi:hypothetical protein
MRSLRVLYHLARADFLERIRRYSFLVTLIAAVYLGYAVIVGDMSLSLGKYRGVYNSAWVGLQMAMAVVVLVSLAGFYVVKDTVDRDLQTRVGQILAATPLSKLDYVLGKALSNFAVLGLIALLLAVLAALGQLWAGEDLRLRLWPLLAPFAFLALPTLAYVAALAVLFEVIPWLRGGFGNIVYFILYLFIMVFGFETHHAFFDFTGIEWLDVRLETWLYAHAPGYTGGLSLGSSGIPLTERFLWSGFDWQLGMISMRLYWFGVALALVLLAAGLFDRFDRTHRVSSEPSAQAGRLRTWWRRRKAGVRAVQSNGAAKGHTTPKPFLHLTPLHPAAVKFRSAPVLAAELRLMLKSQRWWWYLVAAGLLVGSVAEPAEKVRGMLPWLWIWPLLLWSAMGTREARQQTGEFIFSAAHPLRRQFPAAWLAGFVVALLMGVGAALRMLIARDWMGMAGFAVAAAFIPSLAYAMGVWSGTGKLFEAVYVIWWYIGPIHHDRRLDFMLASAQSVSAATLRFYLAATLGLFALALLGRRRQLRT